MATVAWVVFSAGDASSNAAEPPNERADRRDTVGYPEQDLVNLLGAL